MAVYNITRYPRDIELRDGASVTIRPMEAGDARAVLAFFQGIPEGDRFFLKDDVVDPAVIDGWCKHLDYDRALPLLAISDGKVIADAVLVRHRGGCRRHLAEIRIVVAPEHRGRGLGFSLIRELIEIACDAELDQVEFELVVGMQDDAIKACEVLGAYRAGSITDAVRDIRGDLHGIVFMRLVLGNWLKWSEF